MKQFETLVELLQRRASGSSDAAAFTFLDHGGRQVREASLTYGQLHQRARSVGAALAERGVGREPVLLLFPPGLDYVAGFLGAVYGGTIAVPAYPPHPARLQRTLPRVLSLLQSCGARFVLTTSRILAFKEALVGVAPELADIQWLAVDALDDAPSDWVSPHTAAQDVCFLQYTSGSTAEPKGVMVTHANLMANQAMIAKGMGNDASTIGVSWLPMYHDMGLIGHIIQPLYLGIHSVLMSPLAFLARPLRWLTAISRFGGTTSGGPNFAFDLCVRKIADEDLEGIDLSSWRTVYSGAEPVRSETIEQFQRRFDRVGLQLDHIFPCYGLAEATLFVSGGPAGTPPKLVHVDPKALLDGDVIPDAEGRPLVESGQVADGLTLRIVHPETLMPLEENQVGEIWLSGPNVTAGYWNAPEPTTETFGARLATGEGPFLRTGDLGFAREGRLVVTGRLKDLLIVGGRNHYPQDIELTVERCHPSVRRGCCAAFMDEVGGREKLVVALEVERRYRPDRRASTRRDDAASDRRQAEPPPGNEADAATRWDPDELVERVRRAVWQNHEVPVHAVVLLRPGIVPKTSSGKIRRREMRRLFLEGELDPIALEIVGAEASKAREYIAPETPAEQLLASIWEEVLAVPKVGRDDVFIERGGDSVKAAQVVWKARESGLRITLQSMFEHPALRDLAAAAGERTSAPEVASFSASAPEGETRSNPVMLDWVARCGDATGYAVVRALDVAPDLLQRALRVVIDHHAELRTAVDEGDGGLHGALVGTPDALSFERGSLPVLGPEAEDEWLKAKAGELAERLDRSRGVRLATAHFIGDSPVGAGRSSRIVLVADGAAVDEVSWWAILDDLDSAYRSCEEGATPSLPQSISVSAWSARIWDRSEKLPRAPFQLWMEQLELPTRIFSAESSGELGERGTHRCRVVDVRELSSALSADGVTMLDALTASLLTVAREWTGGADARIDVQGSGRDADSMEVLRTVGRFAADEPVGVSLAGVRTASGALGIVRRHAARLKELGVPHAALARCHPDDGVRRRVATADPGQVVARFLGSAGTGRTLPRLGYVTLEPAALRHSHKLVMTASVVDGELSLSAEYPSQRFAREDVERFSSRCAELLRELVTDEHGLHSSERLSRVSLDEQQLDAALTRAMAARLKKS